MSLRKWCDCAAPSKCEHFWFYDFRVNRRRYRNTTETANRQTAKKIEATERTKVLEGRHGIREQPDIAFRAFAETYISDYAELHKKSVQRDREILKVLNRAFGSLILHEITAHRIEQFKRERLAGKWRGHGYKSSPKPLKPGTVNRELDTLRGIFSKAVEWGQLLKSPMDTVKRLKVDNRRTRILSEAEQTALVANCRTKKFKTLIELALVTGARIGELLALEWANVTEAEIVFLETKNGRTRRLPATETMRTLLGRLPRRHPWVFTNPRTKAPYTVNGTAHIFRRALKRADITTGDVSLHTLRHTALSRMIAAGFDDHTVMEISGHSDIRMLSRYTHPTNARKVDALESFSWMGRNRAEQENDEWKSVGGRQEDRTPDLRVANAGGRKRQREDS